MDLIEDYRHGPQLADDTDAGDGDVSGEATFGSRTALPTARPRLARRWLPRRPGSPAGRSQDPRHFPRKRRRRHAALLGLAGRTAAAASLVALGTFIGVKLSGPDSTPRASSPSGLSNGLPAGPPQGPPPSSFAPLASGRPAIEMLQPFGDGNTVFVLHGAGWIPLTRVTVTLVGHGAARYRPVVDNMGTFNYAIDQGQTFFPGPIPPGTYRVVVTGTGGRRASATFQVHPPPRPSPAP
jgi:hypothetical protein